MVDFKSRERQLRLHRFYFINREISIRDLLKMCYFVYFKRFIFLLVDFRDIYGHHTNNLLSSDFFFITTAIFISGQRVQEVFFFLLLLLL